MEEASEYLNPEQNEISNKFEPSEAANEQLEEELDQLSGDDE